MSATSVSVIVPCRNERRYIATFLNSVTLQELPDGTSLEVIIADGNSTDGTADIIRGYAARYPYIRLIDNPERIVSTALNRAIRAASGEIIIRMDVHAEYAPDYIAQCVHALQKTGAQNVGGAARTRAHSYMQQVIAAAYHSRFACGGARFHDVDYEGTVDTVTFGCWRKETLLQLGLFDEELVRNQDDELNYRLIRQGGRIWQSPDIRCWYYPRSSLKDLFRQYAQYGYWKVQVIRKHGTPASVRHLVPAIFVASLVILFALSAIYAPARLALAACLLVYLLANILASLLTCVPRRLSLLPVMPFVISTYHFSYGSGFLAGLISALGAPRRHFVRVVSPEK